MKHLIFDTANLLFRVSSAQGKYNNAGTPEEKAGFAMHVSLCSMHKYFKKYKPDKIAITFEGAHNWRKEYTRSEKCISGKVYKANRVKDASLEPFFELIKSFEDLARKHTSFICLSNDALEGDDIFAGYVKRFCEAGDEVIGVSGDRDFVQLLKYKNFSLIDPSSGKPRTLTEVCGVDNADYFMYEKAFRGDTGDNVGSAYPRVQSKRLKKCFEDAYEHTQIMNDTWSITDPETGVETVFRVGDLFDENQTLMNLNKQPDYIKQIIEETIDYSIANTGKFSFFHFSKFCGKFGLKQIADNASSFAAMLGVTSNDAEEKTENKKSSILQF